MVVSRHAPRGPRFLHIMTVSPVKRVGASVSLPNSSAFAVLDRGVLWRGEVRMARETRKAVGRPFLHILDSSLLSVV